MRVDGSHRNARTGNSGGARAAISQFQLGQNIFGRDCRGDFRQWNVRSYPGVPETFQHIEFTRDARKTDGVGDKTDFVLVTGIYVAHRLLVELRKADGVNRSGLCHVQGAAEVVDGEGAADLRRLAALDLIRREVFQIDEMRGGSRGQRLPLPEIDQCRIHAGNLGALLENAAVA